MNSLSMSVSLRFNIKVYRNNVGTSSSIYEIGALRNGSLTIYKPVKFNPYQTTNLTPLYCLSLYISPNPWRRWTRVT